ncbi:MAG: arginyltransferase [Rhodoferax sp.]
MRCTDSRPPGPSLYTTATYACSYLPERVARSQVAACSPEATIADYDRLIQHGFRRSGHFIYRPHCDACQACQALRIPVVQFQPDRSQRRALKRHAHLIARWLPTEFVEEHFALYQRYQCARHPGGGMDNADEKAYAEYLLHTPIQTQLVEFRIPTAQGDLGQLVMVSVIDRVADGLSAVYTFFEPDPNASWGTYNVLWQIEQARRLQLAYVYLGYWIAESPKMAYKTRFNPHERLVRGRWLPGTSA